MNRQIKFRAWHEEEGWMDEFGLFDLADGFACAGYKKDKPIMQYIGLKDKNGVEIYEGDILEDENGQEVEVTFGSNTYATGGKFVYGFEFEFMTLEENTETKTIVSHRVVSNIYENNNRRDDKGGGSTD